MQSLSDKLLDKIQFYRRCERERAGAIVRKGFPRLVYRLIALSLVKVTITEASTFVTRDFVVLGRR